MLVVDDSAPIRDLIVVNLELEGFEVRAAADGEAGARGRRGLAARRDHARRGDAAAGRLRDAGRGCAPTPGTADIPVVLVTGRAQAADRARGEALGVDAYLTKPFEPARAGRPSSVTWRRRAVRPPIRLSR